MKRTILYIIPLFCACAVFAGEAQMKFIPFSADTPKYKGKIQNLPTGAQDFEVQLPNPQKELVVNAADFGLNESVENSAPIINKALEHCKKIGASKLVLPKGTYKFFSDKDSTTVIVKGFKDFTFDGQGSTFVFRKKWGENFKILENERVRVCNINVDWDWDTDPLSSVVEVVGKNIAGVDDTYVDFKFIDYEDFPAKNVAMVCTSPYDLEADCIGGENGYHNWFDNHSGAFSKGRVDWIKPNVARVYFNKKAKYAGRPQDKDGYKVGMVLRMQHYYYHMNNMLLAGNVHFTLENFNVYSCAGHAFVVGGFQQYWQFLNVNIKRPENAKVRRAITCTADHLHITNSKGFFKMKNCEFSLGADDCINMHDNTGFARRFDDHTLLTQNAHVVGRYKIGDRIELRQGDYSPSGFTQRIAKIETVDRSKGVFKVSFFEKIPEQKFDGFIMFNREYGTRNVIVDNCKFWGNRARGILILASDVTIQNSTFYHIEFGAIKIESGYTFNVWSEGYGARNIVIRNNTFEASAATNAWRDINFNVYMKTDPSGGGTRYPILRDVLIEKNKFIDSYGYVAAFTSCGNVVFRKNTISHTRPRRDLKAYRGTFYVDYASDVKIINNKFISSEFANAGVYVNPETTSNILVEGNTVKQ